MESIKATQWLRDDHKHIRGLFRQLETADERHPEMKESVLKQLFADLEIHSMIEEEIFYPAVAAASTAGDRGLVDESVDEHRMARESIEALRKLDAFSENFNSRLNQLISDVELHVEKEERELLPRAEELLGSRMQELAARMHERRGELIKDPRFSQSRPETAQNPNGGEQIRKPAA